MINFCAVDPKFDLGHDEDELSSCSYLSRIIMHQPNFLFNYTNIGYQTYYVDEDALVLMKNLYFDAYRLGKVRAEMEEIEPMIRNVDVMSFDISAIRQTDAPGNFYANPNGFSGEEACRICRYAGISDKLSSIGFYEYNSSYDVNGQTAKLLAQMIWYFIDGVAHRKDDLPENGPDQFVRFIVKSENFDEDLVFLKSKKTERWWIEMQASDQIREKYRRHQFIPCSYADYQSALNQEIPDRWWKMQQKLM
ncbi:MAG: arginase family protein [bacterium]